MPNLAPKISPQKLKDNWFRICSNPSEDDEENLCIQIIEGPFHHVVIKYKNFKLDPKLNEDGSKLYAKQILKDPEKYFTDDIMNGLDEAAKKEFSYGGGVEEIETGENNG